MLNMLNTDQFAASNQANYDVLTSLSTKAFAGFEQITALNLQVAKAGLVEASETGAAVLAAKDPQALFALQSELLQPAADKATAYGKQVYGIFTSLAADVEKLVGAQTTAAQSSFVALIEAAGKNAPEGSIDGVTLFKSALTTANQAFDSLQKAGREAASIATASAEANFAAVTSAPVKAATKAKRG
jgi:phasin family protein